MVLRGALDIDQSPAECASLSIQGPFKHWLHKTGKFSYMCAKMKKKNLEKMYLAYYGSMFVFTEYPAGASYIPICLTASTAHITRSAMGPTNTHTNALGSQPKTPAPQAVVKTQDEKRSMDSSLTFFTKIQLSVQIIIYYEQPMS